HGGRRAVAELAGVAGGDPLVGAPHPLPPCQAPGGRIRAGAPLLSRRKGLLSGLLGVFVGGDPRGFPWARLLLRLAGALAPPRCPAGSAASTRPGIRG